MRTALLLLLIPILMAQTPAPDPARPFPNHEEPPVGWFCVPASSAAAVETEPHACNCRGMVLEDPEPFCHTEDGEPRGESSTCKVYCHKDHCRCAVRCEGS